MNWWAAAIYGFAAVLAIQGLFALMTAHRKQSLRRYFDEEIRRRELEAAAVPKTESQTPQVNPKKTAA